VLDRRAGGTGAQRGRRRRDAAAEEYREILAGTTSSSRIQDHGLADEAVAREGLAAIAVATGIPLVATNDCHFHARDDVEAHRVLIGIGHNKTLAELARDYAYNDEFYVKSPSEMARLFAATPDAVTRTAEIADRCHAGFPESGFILPDYAVPPGPIRGLPRGAGPARLEARLSDGRERRHKAAEYVARLELELR